jgi:hypothetical protein
MAGIYEQNDLTCNRIHSLLSNPQNSHKYF